MCVGTARRARDCVQTVAGDDDCLRGGRVRLHARRRANSPARRATVGRVDYENSASESARIALFGSVVCELTKSDEARARVSIEDVQFDAEPDARVRRGGNGGATKRPARTDAAVSDSGETPTTSGRSKMDLEMDARNVRGSIFIAPGACAKVSVRTMDARPLRGTCEPRTRRSA